MRNETVLPDLIDVTALIRTLKDIPTTFEELIWKIVKTLLSGYGPMHIIADTYRETSIKSSKQEN